MTEISEAAVEAAAQALHGDACAEDPDSGVPCLCSALDYEREARVILEAAAPAFRKQIAGEIREILHPQVVARDQFDVGRFHGLEEAARIVEDPNV